MGKECTRIGILAKLAREKQLKDKVEGSEITITKGSLQQDSEIESMSTSSGGTQASLETTP